MTFHDLINSYLVSLVARNLRESYIQLQARLLLRFVTNIKLNQPELLKPQHVSEYLAALFASGQKASTVQVKRGGLCSFLNWCSTEEYIPMIDWSKRVPALKTDMQPVKALTFEQTQRLIAAVHICPHVLELVRRRDVAMLFVLLDTGMREGELLRLNLDDIDLLTREIRISALAKGRRSRRVWLSEETVAVLQRYIRYRRKLPGEHLWTTKFRTRMGKSMILTAIKKYGRMAGIQNLTVHQLRHTALTQMVRSGMQLSAVCAVAGHSQIRTTERYLHLLNEDVRVEAMRHSVVSAYL